MVSVAPPPPSRLPRPVHASVAATRSLVRIYNPLYLEPNGYNHYGPLSRFDHHDGSLDAPAIDPLHGTYYAGNSLSACLVEVFGDAGVIEASSGRRVAVVEPTRDLFLLDLRSDGAWRAGSVAAITKHADRQLSQSWARHFYTETGVYGTIDGLVFENAHNGESAYALFERAGPLRVRGDYALTDPRLAGELATCANELGLVLA